MSLGGFTILLVDDSEVSLTLWSALLRQEGYDVEAATNGQQAIDMVASKPLDLILLDVIMPDLDGFEVLEKVREEHPPTTLPVIMATGKDESEDMVKAFDLGANDYVTKPLDKGILLARIQAQLRSKIPARATAFNEAENLRSPKIQAGTILDGKYRLDSLIDRGNFGSVFRGAHIGLDRPVAIKLLATKISKDPGALSRFQQEGISACRTRHPNAVAVYDFSVTEEGVPFLVMELLQGHNLGEELRQKRAISPRRFASILLPICEVLTEAHSLGIIHRDIKPQNIFLHQNRHGETVKVLDFGIAKIIGGVTLSQRVTQEGSLVGTPAYMAPERFSDLPYCGSSDVFSLGVVTYEALAGRRPFSAGTGVDILELIQVGERIPPPSLSELVPGLPSGMSQLVQETLAEDPSQRPSPAELARRFKNTLGPISADSVDKPDGALSQSLLRRPNASSESSRWVKTLPDLRK